MEVPNPRTSSDPFIIPPSSTHTHSAIILHGRGHHGYAFGTLLSAAQTSTGETLPQLFPGTKFIFPTAPLRRSAVMSRVAGGAPGGVRINQWFDNHSLQDPSKRQDMQREGLRETAATIHSLIREEARLVGLRNVVLGGLSQGCAAMLHVLLSFQPEVEETDGAAAAAALGGFVGMSGWLPFEKDILEAAWPEMRGRKDLPARQVSVANFAREIVGLPPLRQDIDRPAFVRCPCLVGHGSADDLVPMRLGADAWNALNMLGVRVFFKAYVGFGHWWKEPDEIDDIVAFLNGGGEHGMAL